MEQIERHTIFAEVAAAYSDCSPAAMEDQALQDAAMATRNLGFRASQAVDPRTAAAIMERCCPGYNEFEPALLLKLPDDCAVIIAREGSVCVYVRPGETPMPDPEDLQASEYEILDADVYDIRKYYKGGRPGYPTPYGGFKGEIRIWWD